MDRIRTVIFICACLPLLARASSLPCSFGSTLKFRGQSYDCQITGSAMSRLRGTSHKTYFANCSDWHVEFLEGTTAAQIIDVVTRQRIGDCPVVATELATMIQAHESKKSDLENPKCVLSQWNGQMTYQANGISGRCSFNMNKVMAENFKKSTGAVPVYQCENDYFLVGDQGGFSIYKKTATGWSLECKAVTKTDTPIAPIDWKNPPQYYQPAGPTVTPGGN
jgi:hypothetical protein